MILQHGTSSSNTISDISRTGLKPRQGKGNWFRETQMPSMDSMVYLTNVAQHWEFHAARTAILTQSECAVIDVDVDEHGLYPDENLFSKNELVYVPDLVKMQEKVLSNKSKWEISLAKTGMVSHLGAISEKRIVDIRRYPLKDSPFYSFIKNCAIKDIDSFDLSYQTYMQLCDCKWLQGCKTNPVFSGLDLIRELDIYHNDKSVTVYLQSNSITVKWNI